MDTVRSRSCHRLTCSLGQGPLPSALLSQLLLREHSVRAQHGTEREEPSSAGLRLPSSSCHCIWAEKHAARAQDTWVLAWALWQARHSSFCVLRSSMSPKGDAQERCKSGLPVCPKSSTMRV